MRSIRAAFAIALLLAVAACASAPPPVADLTPPQRPCDAKTQLETGRKVC